MPDFRFTFADFPPFARAMRVAAPRHLVRAVGKAFFRIGKSDIERMKTQGLGRLNIRFKGFANSFKFRATDSRLAKTVDQIQLSEYTGAKPFRIFDIGGEISPIHARTLTVLAAGARNAAGARKYTRKQLRAMIESGEAKIIPTKAGPAIVKSDERLTKKGTLRRGSKVIILAWLRPRVSEQKRIDFEGNFQANSGEHERILAEAADEAIAKTEAEEEGEGEI